LLIKKHVTVKYLSAIITKLIQFPFFESYQSVIYTQYSALEQEVVYSSVICYTNQ